jgi:hypothetical protein
MKNSLWLVLLVGFGIVFATSAFTIDCSFEEWDYEQIGSLYTCVTQNTQFPSNHTVTNTTGIHMNNHTDADVKAIWIQGMGSLSFFPRESTNFFPNIIAVLIGGTVIDTMHGDELSEFGQQLQWFFMYSSSVSTVSSRLFEAGPDLVVAGFVYCELERVGRNLFTSLNVTRLRELNFNNNPCISRYAFNETDITELIEELQVSCPFDDEEPVTTTTEPDETTIDGQTCFDDDIDDFVCELSENVTEVQSELINTRNELQLQLDQTNEKLENSIDELAEAKRTVSDLESRVQWLEDKILEITTKP